MRSRPPCRRSNPLPARPSAVRRQLLLGGAALATGCGGGAAPEAPAPALQVTVEGLQGLKVARLRESPLGLLAATNSGLHRLAAGGWQPLGLSGRDLVDVAALSGGRLVASSRLDGLFVSDDAGRSWQRLISDFGGPSGPETAWALVADAGRLLATHGYGVAASDDGGRSWRLLAGRWGSVSTGMPALTPGPRGEIWFGGQNAIEQLVLGRWSAAGLAQWERLMPSPSVVTSVRLVPGEPLRALVCGEGGIIQTRDDGRTWTPVFVNREHRFYFDVLRDPARPGRWVSAGYRKTDEPQPLRLAISEDDGVTWQEVDALDGRFFGGVLSMALSVENGRSVFRFGTAGGGVVRVTIGAAGGS